ncbi:ABC1 kinase family protein [Amycolatopsis magusensis]|uniref:Unusual protein kinase regulating ubiquinone biosynthesis (AarF/ABC1/UbiB family) n=1 Tax=Amycolatopsis magusensis TaxID=882444 RepID=A0ABS4PNB8_9PSEU|nr:AarF/ABC1/UbiB kinase family protein [Amycolatopsis magusensis]MBP2180353.1 putative unusual protein kinase regulating ubiquinone biosynthesis (AarF/ABC1/UbiB family) [Amycolatopsis magusensis]MDI5977760.1 AarF/ABC1/UbiB kinase family protein [Amycolatopsis magusensis]
MTKAPPTSRLVRATALGRLAAGQVLRQAGTKVAGLGRSSEKRQLLLDRRALAAADQLVSVLGGMKGAAMKLGQLLSVLDLDLVPDSSRPEFRRKLAVLLAKAPAVPFSDMRKVAEDDWGAPIAEVFAEFDRNPVAAASIGQVYRARLHDGRAVAVKVQYPGIATAVRADLKNLALFLRLAPNIFPGLEMGSLAEEIRLRIEEELDYRLEAETQHEIAVQYAGHPFIAIPDSVAELCGPQVLVTEFVEGMDFDGIAEQPREVRDRVGEIIYRFYCGSLFHTGDFPGDPHPGNVLLRHDGRVAFLDFGLFKRMSPESIHLERTVLRAAADGDAEQVHARMAAAGILGEPDRIEPDEVLAYIEDAVGWYLADAEIEATPELAAEAMISSIDPRSPHYRKMRWQYLPPEHLFARRAELYAFGLLGRLRARGNWHRIAREWLHGDEPATELGQVDAKWRAGDTPEGYEPR